MLQLEDELSLLELPCLVNEEVMDKFCEDLHDQRGQRHNDDSSKNSLVIKPASSRQNTMDEKTSRTSQTSKEHIQTEQNLNQEQSRISRKSAKDREYKNQSINNYQDLE